MYKHARKAVSTANKAVSSSRGKVSRNQPAAKRSPTSNSSSASSSNSSSTSTSGLPPFKFAPYSPLTLPSERPGLSSLVAKITDFNQLKIRPEIRDVLFSDIKANTVLRAQNHISNNNNSKTKVKTEDELNGLIVRPTPIQTAAIKIINDRRRTDDFFKVFTIAAETGSGKTWAYLAPLYQQLLEGRESTVAANAATATTTTTTSMTGDIPDSPTSSTPVIKKRPGISSIILLPTHELVDQVYATVENSATKLGLSVLKWDTDSNFKTFIEAFKSGIDIMVTTPPKLNSLSNYDSIAHPRMIFGSATFCVVDEADTLMDPSFVTDTNATLKHMKNLDTLVFASATVPSRFNKTINHLFPTTTTIATPALHKLPKSIEFRVINAAVAPYKGSKMKALAQALYAIHADGSEQGFEKRVIVFVNTKEDSERVADKLRTSFNHDVTAITSVDDPHQRRAKVAPFLTLPRRLDPGEAPTLKVLVCTDLLSRGLNFYGIRNVVLLDVPANSADLVHRAGRTGRMNMQGRVFLIVNDADRGHVRGLPKVLRNNRRLG